MAPQYGAGSCCCLSWWGGSIEFRFRHSDLCDSAGLSRFDFFDRRVPDRNRESERQRCQLHCRHTTASELDRCVSLFTGTARLRDLQWRGNILIVDYQVDGLMDIDWTKNLTLDEAQAALDALDAHNTSVTARQAVELLRLRRALQKVARAGQLMNK